MNAEVSCEEKSFREEREYRHSVVVLLSDWLERDESLIIDGTDWAAISRLPTWCLLEQHDIRRLAELVGVLYHAETIKGIIDGERLRECQELIGATLFAEVLKAPLLVEANTQLDFTSDLAEGLSQTGFSVLICTIKDRSLAEVLSRHIDGFQHSLSPESPLAIPQELAMSLLNAAFELFNRNSEGGGLIGTGDIIDHNEKKPLVS